VNVLRVVSGARLMVHQRAGKGYSKNTAGGFLGRSTAIFSVKIVLLEYGYIPFVLMNVRLKCLAVRKRTNVITRTIKKVLKLA
jgi:hypothetical protein